MDRVIKTCEQCAFYDENSCWCAKLQMGLTGTMAGTIPDECPLPTVESSIVSVVTQLRNGEVEFSEIIR